MTNVAPDERGATPSAGSGGTVRQLLLALGVGLVLADSSVVTLALPAILREFDSSVNAVAWVLISFNLVLALAAVRGARAARGRAPRAFLGAIVLFILATAVCAAAWSLPVLIVARAAQGLFGAVAVAAALELLVLSAGRNRAVLLWAAAGVLGAAVGPALGGFLTEALSWRAMFALQAPVAILALLGARGVPQPAAAAGGDVIGERPATMPLVALALASAALSAALFLLVILLIEGWRHSPAEAALTVTVMPIAALFAGQWARAPRARPGGRRLAARRRRARGAGAHAGRARVLVAGAAAGDRARARAGAGDADRRHRRRRRRRRPGDRPGGDRRARRLDGGRRHAGIVVGLLLLTPLFTADLNSVRPPAERAGLSNVLDAPLSLASKIELARRLDAQVKSAGDQELPDLDKAFADLDVEPSERPAIAVLRAQLDDELDRGATKAFSRSFSRRRCWRCWRRARRTSPRGGGAASARGGLARVYGARTPRLAVAVTAAGAAAAALVAVYVALGGAGFGPREVADPCAPRERPPVDARRRRRLRRSTGPPARCA